MKRLLSILITINLLFTPACGTGADNHPENVGITYAASDIEGHLPSSLEFSELERTIDRFFLKNENRVAAFSVAVFTAKNLVLEKAYGYSGGAPPNFDKNDSGTVFDWGSITKVLVWVSVMQLYERGLLDLHEDIRVYLPEGFMPMSKYRDPITMLNLMNHRTGLAPFTYGGLIDAAADDFDFGEFLRKNMPEQEFHPGTVSRYQSFNGALAGYIVECISGGPFYEYVHKNIFAALGMTRTALKPGFSDNHFVQERYSRLVSFNNGRPPAPVGGRLWSIPIYPGGQAAGTLSDMRKLAQALLPDENGKSILFEKSETLTKMYSPSHIGDPIGANVIRHGFMDSRFGTPGRGMPPFGHSGVTTGGVAWLLIDIENNVGVVFMSNVIDERLFSSEIPRLIFGG